MEATQGLVVAAAVAVTTATVLAAVAVVVQAVIQLDADVSLQWEQEQGRVNITHMTNASPPAARARREGGRHRRN